MDDLGDVADSDAKKTVERGKTYNHSEYGRVEVTGIWRGVNQVDSAHNTKENDMIIVRYSRGGKLISELTDTLDEFLEAIEDEG